MPGLVTAEILAPGLRGRVPRIRGWLALGALAFVSTVAALFIFARGSRNRSHSPLSTRSMWKRASSISGSSKS